MVVDRPPEITPVGKDADVQYGLQIVLGPEDDVKRSVCPSGSEPKDQSCLPEEQSSGRRPERPGENGTFLYPRHERDEQQRGR